MRLKPLAILAFLAFCLLPGLCLAANIEPKADEILRQASQALVSLGSFSVTEYALVDQVLPSGQKIKLSQSAEIKVERPGKLKAVVEGDEVSCVLLINGAKSLLYNGKENAYASLSLPETLDAALDVAIQKLGVAGPMTDLLAPNPYAVLTSQVLEGFYVGLSSIDNKPCHHLAFRQLNIDWEIWIDAGKTSLPIRLVITDKSKVGSPQQLLKYAKWTKQGSFSAKEFSFSLPKNAVRFEVGGQAPSGAAK